VSVSASGLAAAFVVSVQVSTPEIVFLVALVFVAVLVSVYFPGVHLWLFFVSVPGSGAGGSRFCCCVGFCVSFSSREVFCVFVFVFCSCVRLSIMGRSCFCFVSVQVSVPECCLALFVCCCPLMFCLLGSVAVLVFVWFVCCFLRFLCSVVR